MLSRTNRLSFKNIFALVIGNALEWYDFFAFSFMTVYIAKVFFPNHSNSLLLTTATFGMAFLMRPIGGIILGVYSDIRGRIATINIIIIIMAISLAFICFMPSYHSIGIMAPIFIIFARLLQGFSAGGEYAASASILIELAPQEQRGFYSSWQTTGQLIALLFGTLVGTLLTSFLTEQELENWGWRIPFLIGLLIVPVGMYLRRHFQNYDITKPNNKPMYVEVKNKTKQILLVMGLVGGPSVITYTHFSYLPTFATQYLHMSMHEAFLALVFNISLMIFLTPLIGVLSDKFNKKMFLMLSVCGYLVVTYPLYWWLTCSPTFHVLLIVLCLQGLILSCQTGVLTAVFAELFPMHIRSTCISLGYNCGISLFGGFSQFIVTWILQKTHNPIAVVIYPLLVAVVWFIAVFYYKENKSITVLPLAALQTI